MELESQRTDKKLLFVPSSRSSEASDLKKPLKSGDRLQLYNGYKDALIFCVLVVIKLVVVFVILQEALTIQFIVGISLAAVTLIAQALWMTGGTYLQADVNGYLRIIQENFFASKIRDVGGETETRKLIRISSTKTISSTFGSAYSKSIAFVIDDSANHCTDVLNVSTNFRGDRLKNLLTEAKRRMQESSE
jgi:hypothetical protein